MKRLAKQRGVALLVVLILLVMMSALAAPVMLAGIRPLRLQQKGRRKPL
jgi:type II secretory pathway component PulK